MADFLLTATENSGNRETVRIQAENSQDAFQQLESKGYRDIVLHTSDAEATIPLEVLESEKISPSDFVQLRNLSLWEFFLFMLKRSYAQTWWVVVIGALVLAYRWWNSETLGVPGILAIAGISLPCVVSIAATLFQNALRRYFKT